MPFPELPLSAPSLLFPAISLLMLAYTNRFLGLASVVRGLHANWQNTHEPILLEQIRNLRRRIQIIKHMQTLGVLSILMCVVSMALIFFRQQTGAQITFGLSLLLKFSSLTLSLIEIQMSGKALDILLSQMKSSEE